MALVGQMLSSREVLARLLVSTLFLPMAEVVVLLITVEIINITVCLVAPGVVQLIMDMAAQALRRREMLAVTHYLLHPLAMVAVVVVEPLVPALLLAPLDLGVVVAVQVLRTRLLALQSLMVVVAVVVPALVMATVV